MHTLIVGQTQTGKSALAKALGSQLRANGEEVIGFNPTGELGYTRRDQYGCAAAEFETWDPLEFKAECERRIGEGMRRRWLIIDEAHELIGRSDDNDTLWIGTRGRHYGFNIIAVTQAGQQLNPTFRGQCARLYLFRCSLTDARFMADQYGRADLAQQALDLPNGRYLRLEKGQLTEAGIFATQ